MKLYTYFQSSGAYRVRIALNLKGLSADMEYVNLLKGEQRGTAYAKVNPQGLVPTLVDQNHTLIQSLSIIEYLDDAYPLVQLLPSDPFVRAYVRALSYIISSDTSPLGNLKVRKHLEALGQSKEQVKQWMQHWTHEGLTAFEKTLASEAYRGDFCYGDEPTMADCCLMPQVFNALRWKCDMSAYPLIQRIAGTCDAHPAFIAAHPSQQKDAV